MDINIIVQDHKNSAQAQAYFEEELSKAFSAYSFISSCELHHLKEEPGEEKKISLEMRVKNTKPIFVSSVGMSDEKVFKSVLKKAKRQLEKYKTAHYRSESFK